VVAALFQRNLSAYLGMQPRSFWNPECGWRTFVPAQAHAAGYVNLLGDFEATAAPACPMDSRNARKSTPRNTARNRLSTISVSSMTCLERKRPSIFPSHASTATPGTICAFFLRTDRIAQFGVRFFMNMEGYSLEEYLQLIRQYSEQPAASRKGRLIIFADDAEYIAPMAGSA